MNLHDNGSKTEHLRPRSASPDLELRLKGVADETINMRLQNWRRD